MVRADRNRPDVYFGRPGSLVKLPWPRGDMDAPYERLTYDFTTGQGQHQVSSLASGSRLFTLSWDALHVDNFSLLSEYRIGVNGQGPWVLINPSAPNLMRINVAASTGVYNDTRQFKVASGNIGTLSSNLNSSFIHRTRGTRSLRWLFPSSPAGTSVLETTYAYRSWHGHPCVPGLSYVFSSWARPDGVVDSSIQMAMKIQWLNSSGGAISESSGGDSVMTGWQRYSVVATAPAGAAYMRPTWVATGSTITAGGSIYLDEIVLEQDSVVNDWAPGTGIRPVEIVDLSETVPFAARFRTGADMVLRELAE